MPDIFDEVDEDLRAERARRFLVRWGGAIAGAAVLIVLGVGGWQAWRYYDARASAGASDQYAAASRLADSPAPDRAAAIAAFERVTAEGGAGYRTLARLREAALKADGGDAAGAAALWSAVAGDSGADPVLRGLASLQWAMHDLDHGDPQQIAGRLAPLAAPDNPWHALAEEAQAMLAIRQGKPDAARDTLKQLAADASAPDGVRGRANGLLARLGGS